MTRLRRLVLAHGLAAVAMAMPWPALLALTWAQTHSETSLAVVGGARMAPYVLLSWAAGALGDRVPRTLLLHVSAQVRALLLALTLVAVVSEHLGTAIALATLVVASGTPAYPALAAAMPATAGPRSETATSWLVTLEVSAFVVGPAIGGLLLSLAGARTALATAVVAAVAAAGLLTGLRLGSGDVPDQMDGKAPARQLALVLASSDAVRVITAVAIINVVIGAVGVALLPMAERTWGDAHVFGLMTAALGLGALATPAVRRLLALGPTAIRASLTLVVLPLGLVAATPAWGWAVAPLVLLGAAATEVECVATTILQRSVPDQARAFALGLTDTVMVTGALFGASLAPWCAGTFGPRALFAAFAAATALLLLVSTRAPVSEPAKTSTPQFT